MKNYKKILIVLGILTLIAVFAISPTFAATKTIELNSWGCYYDTDGTASMTYSKKLNVGSTKFYVHSSMTVNLRKGKNNYEYPLMAATSNKKFKSATMHLFNVKTLKTTKKIVKAQPIDPEFRDKNNQYVAQHVFKRSSNWIPHKIVINY